MLTTFLRVAPWLCLAAAYAKPFSHLYAKRWEILDYTHAYYILPVALYLVWANRSALPTKLAPASSLLCFTGLVISLSIYFIGVHFDYIFLTTLSLIPLAASLTAYLYGSPTLKAVIFPILYLAFLVPPPLGVLDAITLPMRYGVSIATEQILAILSYPIRREGLLLWVGGQEVYLGEACSGFRSLITLGALGSAYIYLSKVAQPKKWLMGSAIIPLALVGNLVRVLSVCLVTFYLGVSKGQQYYHDLSGFVVFLFLLGGLLWLEKR